MRLEYVGSEWATEPIGQFEWSQIVRSLDESPGGSLLSPLLLVSPTARSIALWLHLFARTEGDRIYPTVRTLCALSGKSDKTVRDALAELRAAGVVERVSHRPTLPDQYRLTIPAPVRRFRLVMDDEGTGGSGLPHDVTGSGLPHDVTGSGLPQGTSGSGLPQGGTASGSGLPQGTAGSGLTTAPTGSFRRASGSGLPRVPVVGYRQSEQVSPHGEAHIEAHRVGTSPNLGQPASAAGAASGASTMGDADASPTGSGNGRILRRRRDGQQPSGATPAADADPDDPWMSNPGQPASAAGAASGTVRKGHADAWPTGHDSTAADESGGVAVPSDHTAAAAEPDRPYVPRYGGRSQPQPPASYQPRRSGYARPG